MYDRVEVIIIVAVAIAGVTTGSVVTLMLMGGERDRWDGIKNELIADRKAMREAANRVLQATNGVEEHGHSDSYEDQVVEGELVEDDAELREQISEAFVARRPDGVPGPERAEPIIPVQENPYVFDFLWNPNTKVVHRADCKRASMDCDPLTSMGVNDLIAIMREDGLRGCKACDPAREKEQVEVHPADADRGYDEWHARG